MLIVPISGFDGSQRSKRHGSRKLYVTFPPGFAQGLTPHRTRSNIIFIDFSRGISEKIGPKNHPIFDEFRIICFILRALLKIW